MKRHPELAHAAGLLPEVQALKHKAIDMLTAAHIKVGLINRYDQEPVEELEKEEALMEYMEDAAYYFRKYLHAKLDAYEKMLRAENVEQWHSIQKGNELIDKHSKDLDYLKSIRGIHEN